MGSKGLNSAGIAQVQTCKGFCGIRKCSCMWDLRHQFCSARSTGEQLPLEIRSECNADWTGCGRNKPACGRVMIDVRGVDRDNCSVRYGASLS